MAFKKLIFFGFKNAVLEEQPLEQKTLKTYIKRNFEINNIDDFYHQKFSYSEWYSHMSYKFSFLNNDINKTIRKILKFI